MSWQKSTFSAGAMIRRRSWINGLRVAWFPPGFCCSVAEVSRRGAEAQRNGATARMGCNSCGPFSAPPRLCVRSDGSPRRRGRKFRLGKCAANFNRKASGVIWGFLRRIRGGAATFGEAVRRFAACGAGRTPLAEGIENRVTNR
jgi:hypothetical protein